MDLTTETSIICPRFMNYLQFSKRAALRQMRKASLEKRIIIKMRTMKLIINPKTEDLQKMTKTTCANFPYKKV